MQQKRYAININKYLIDSERIHLEDLIKRFMSTKRRDCLLLKLGLVTGARAQELLNLKIDDFNFSEKTLFIRGLKGSNDREIPLSNSNFNDLKYYIQSEKLEDKIFPISYNRLRQIWQLYRPVEKKFHCLRHTFAIQLYKKTKDLRLLQYALGHRNINNTIIYADYVYTQTELKKLIL